MTTPLLHYNGGCVVAMCGKECVAIGSDHRFGAEGLTISANFAKVFQVNARMLLGLFGLQTDVLTVRDRIMQRKQLFETNTNEAMDPISFASMVSNLLYEHRFASFYTEPVIAALDPTTMEPYICKMDILGCRYVCDKFVVAGTCADQLYGMCESSWKPDLGPDDIFEVISQALLNAFNRDSMSGGGATIHVMDKKKLTTKVLKCRMD